MAHTITLKSDIDGFEFAALQAAAEGRRRGGVLVVQEIYGLDRYLREDVARWASRGFEVIAPSMFDRKEPGYTAERNMEGMMKGVGYAVASGDKTPLSDVRACVEVLRDKGPVFIVGYSYGGWIAWRAAAEVEGIAASSSYYGGRIYQDAQIDIKIPIICHFARKDDQLPADATKAQIAAFHPEIPVYIYEGSGHGFNNDGVDAQDPADAQLARERTLELFEMHGAT